MRLTTALAALLRQVFEVGRRLADSIYGAVHVGFTVEQNPETGAYQRVNADGSGRVALKRMSRSKIEELRRRGVGDDPFAEARLLRFANARNDLFVELLALLITDDEVIMVTEFMEGGDLLSAISDHRPGTFTHAEVRVIATRVALALHFLHELGLCNNDLSMENILVKYKNDGSGAPFVVKVIDVGMARQMPRLLSAAAVDADPYAFGRFSSYVSPGKAKYAAVEALGSYVGWRNDMWALGVVVRRSSQPRRAPPLTPPPLVRYRDRYACAPPVRVCTSTQQSRSAPASGTCAARACCGCWTRGRASAGAPTPCSTTTRARPSATWCATRARAGARPRCCSTAG